MGGLYNFPIVVLIFCSFNFTHGQLKIKRASVSYTHLTLPTTPYV